MKKNKNIIKLLIIILIVIIIVLIYLFGVLNKSGNKNIFNNLEEEYASPDNTEYEYKEVEEETSKTTLYILQECLNKNTQNYCFIEEIYRINNEVGKTYAVKGIENYTEIYYIIYLDYINSTYKLEQIQNTEYDKIREGNINNEWLKKVNIEKNKENTFNLIYMTDLKIANLYFDIIKNLINSEPEVLYNILDSEYQQKRFENIESFREYLNVNKEKFVDMQISKYAKYNYDDYLQYVCLDTNGNYYIINEDIETGEYSIFLDTYTIDQPEFIEKYEKATDEQKAGYNINKFIQAINEKDYNYAYNCLAESFKQNNFNTLNDFENYMKNNFTNKIELEYLKTYKEGQYFVYETNIINKNNLSIIDKKNFIVNLKENREFEISFNV